MITNNFGFRFTLVNYNILSHTILNAHGYLYKSCNSRDLQWPRRGHRILSELLHKKADIICLQEVESEHLKSLYRPRLARHGYECLYKKKTGHKVDGCAIFFKGKLFDLLSYKGIEFNRTDLSDILHVDNVGIVAVLKPKFSCESDTKLVVANTHLIFNPKRSDIKLAQLRLFLSELEEISSEDNDISKNEHYHHPTILCGDLNSVPDSDVIKFVMKNATPLVKPKENEESKNLEASQEDPDDFDAERRLDKEAEKDSRFKNLSHTFQFKSVHPIRNRAGQSYVSTLASDLFDYIFYTPKLVLESYTELLTDEELKEVGPIPNSEFPSDHLKLEAQFRLPGSTRN